ncbi:MAG TPA: hypothetical protein VFQ61_14515, partial [Polyangiaceae bacterium]|nr:hypothetical protein [Polyangiaceae bacterium]
AHPDVVTDVKAARRAPSDAPQPAATSRRVALHVEPADAHAFLAGEDKGSSPVMLDVVSGQSVELEIRRDGYRSAKVIVDDSLDRRVVKLERIAPRAVYAAPPPHTPRPASASQDVTIIDPWKKH